MKRCGLDSGKKSCFRCKTLYEIALKCLYSSIEGDQVGKLPESLYKLRLGESSSLCWDSTLELNVESLGPVDCWALEKRTRISFTEAMLVWSSCLARINIGLRSTIQLSRLKIHWGALQVRNL